MVHLQPLQRMQLQRGVEHLHTLGPRAEVEFLAELAHRIGGLPAILALLNDYATISTRQLRTAGGDHFPPRPLRRVA